MPRSQVQPFSSTTSHSHWAAQRLSSNSLSRYYVLEKILIPIVLYTNRGDGDFFFLSIENIVGRRNASPPGDKRKRKPARRSCGFEIRRPKRLDHFNADLQSASSENAKRGYEKPTAADCKSAIKRSSLF